MGVAIPLGYVEDKSSGALVVDGSLRFDSGKSQYLTRTPSSSGNRKTFTWSYWVKRTNLSTDQMSLGTADASGNNGTYVYMISTDVLRIEDYSTSAVWRLDATQVFRDASAWYHILFAVDTTQTTNSNRVKLYINGVQVTAFSTATYPTLNYDCFMNSNTNPTSIGRTGAYNLIYSGFCISNVYFIDGQALDPSYFGYTDALTNTWRPKKFKPQATPNDGTVWSSGTVTNTGSGIYSGSWANVFDGDFSSANNNWVYVYSNSTTRLTFPKALSGLIEIYGSNGATFSTDSAGTDTIVLSDSSTYDVSAITTSNAVWYSFGQKTGITYIEIRHNAGSGQGTILRSIRVNGVPLLDSDTTNIGLNGFYLPFDGSAPIGQDQSGRGNNWTPVNFGGSNTLEKATGALPILNTDGGGKVARVGVRTDSIVSSGLGTCVLALPLVGSTSDFSNQIDSRSTTQTITNNGGATASSSINNFYGGSYYFDGSNDYLSLGSSAADWKFLHDGTTAFTVECWLYYVSFPGINATYVSTDWGSSASAGFTMTIQSGPYLNCRMGNGSNSGDFMQIDSPTLSLANKWTHVAATYDLTTLRLFADGVLVASTTSKNTPDTGNPLHTVYIGGNPDTTYGSKWLNGYLQDIRVYKGLAKYTQNFIPASTDPDILPDTPSGVSYTSNLTQITDGAVAFDGSGDYLSLGSSADFAFGTGDFTAECFVYPSSNANFRAILDTRASVNDANGWILGIDATDEIYIYSNGYLVRSGAGAVPENRWYHVAYVRSSGTHALYIDGKSVSTSGTSKDFTTQAFRIGATPYDGTENWFGFISNSHIVKGTALYTSNFTPPTAPITSVANTKLLCCKSNSSATAFDVSPGTITANGNAAATNFNPFTVNINTQRGKQSGYATMNPLDKGSEVTLANGNLNVTWTNVSGHSVRATTSISTGKWYWEVVTGANASIGIIKSDLGIVPSSGALWPGANGFGSGGSYAYSPDGNKVTNSSYSSYGTAFTNGDIVGVAFDAINGSIYFSYNGIWQGNGNPSTGTNPAYSGISTSASWGPAIGYWTAPGSNVNALNFGQKPFKFPPPAGFQPLALANTPRPTIVRPDQFVGVSTWSGAQSGSGGLTRQISLGMQPDFVWIKQRNQAYSTGHQLYDSVRGAGAEKELNSSGTAAEGAGNIETYGWLNSFDKTGFTVKGGSSDYDYVDKSGVNYVGWAWKAGGNSNTYNINDVGYATASAAGLTAGTITPTGASVNTKSGFSIITYNGNLTTTGNSTVGHGLGRTPAFWISKSRSSTGDDSGAWVIWHKNLSSNTFLRFSTATPQSSDGTLTQPTSSVFTTTWNSGFNVSGNTYVAYIWAEIPGFSKFGTYTGNNSTDGSVVITGFKPRWIMMKCTQDVAGDVEQWIIRDGTRNPYNAVNANLYANLSNAEDDASGFSGSIDILSNGFKLRGTYGAINASATYIYAAFAETPTQNLYGAQANAR